MKNYKKLKGNFNNKEKNINIFSKMRKKLCVILKNNNQIQNNLKMISKIYYKNTLFKQTQTK